MPSCEQCRFFFAHPAMNEAAKNTISISAGGIRGGGECRLLPPVRVESDLIARFPVVTSDCWCGRFKSRE